jgi:hypothetical protein
MVYRAQQKSLDLSTLNLPEGDEVRITVRHCSHFNKGDGFLKAMGAHQLNGANLLSGDKLFLEAGSDLFLLTVTKSLL